MRKHIKLSLLLLLTLLFVVACGESNDDKNNDNSDDGNEDSEEVLGLNDTGTLETNLGDFEVTPTAIEIQESIDGETPVNDGYNFVIIDVIIENIGETTLEAKDIAESTTIVIISDEPRTSTVQSHYDFPENKITEDLKPGDKAEGQLLFEVKPSEYYDLTYGNGLPSFVSNKVTWRIDSDEVN